MPRQSSKGRSGSIRHKLINPASALQSSPESVLTLIELGAILLGLGVTAFLAYRLKFSVVPFYLLIGLFLGRGGVFPLELSEDFLNTGAQLGAIALLLMLGLEYSGRELIGAFLERRSVGVIDFAANFIPGAIAAFFLGWGVSGALVLGGITFVSSSGIAAQLIKDTGWSKSELARRVTSVLVFEDMLLAPYLPLLTAMILNLGVLAGLVSVSIALLITGLVLLISTRQQNALAKLLSTSSPGGLLLTVFGSAMLAAGLAEQVGFSSAVAAFLVGLLLTGEVASAVRLRLSPLRDLFAAIFFVFFGLSIDPVSVWTSLPLGFLLAVLGAAGKLATGWATTRGMSGRDYWLRAAAYLTPRGEFSLVIAGLASVAWFAENLASITLTYVLVTTVISSVALKILSSKFESV
jgi:monovalent cation:H+ antiporter-2, CPA2 family